MTGPIIPADYWLDRADLEEIEKAVDLMLDRLSQGRALTEANPTPSVRKRRILSAGTASIVHPREIEASYSRTSGSIELKPFPNSWNMAQGHGRALADDLMVFRFALRSLLAHEVSHIRQHDMAAADLAAEFDVAETASKKAEQTKTYSDYLLYLGCAVEFAAHATQLAVEVLDSYGPGLTNGDFSKRCRQAWVFRRANKGEKWSGIDEETRLSAFMPVALEWIEQAYFAYGRMTT